MSNTEIVQSWKSGDCTDTPAGAAELNEEQLFQISGGRDGGGGNEAEALTSLPCISLATLTLSCHMGCNTVLNGSCKLFTEGCCQFE